MKKSKFTESQIIKALKVNEQGRKVGDISREMGIDTSTFYCWRKKYGGMDLSI
ncbi:transposase [Pseudozobellia sp. WGM2]|uniref:transposase n=1 Tax=Pseudozobellia sp. WGM2 TaxID=2787625 RepID=UPI001ADF4156